MFIARVKNFIKWWLILTVVVEVALVVYDSSIFLSIEGLIGSLVIGLIIATFKGVFNETFDKVPWGLRHMQQAQPQKKQKRSNKYNSRSKKSASASYYDSNASKRAEAERRRKKQEADEAVRERTRKANEDAYNRYKNIDNAIYQDYLSKQSPKGSYDEEWHNRQGDWYEDEARKY